MKLKREGTENNTGIEDMATGFNNSATVIEFIPETEGRSAESGVAYGSPKKARQDDSVHNQKRISPFRKQQNPNH
jgi:hypothetical protein